MNELKKFKSHMSNIVLTYWYPSERFISDSFIHFRQTQYPMLGFDLKKSRPLNNSDLDKFEDMEFLHLQCDLM